MSELNKDYAKPVWQNKKESKLKSWAAFVVVILLLTLGGSDF